MRPCQKIKRHHTRGGVHHARVAQNRLGQRQTHEPAVGIYRTVTQHPRAGARLPAEEQLHRRGDDDHPRQKQKDRQQNLARADSFRIRLQSRNNQTRPDNVKQQIRQLRGAARGNDALFIANIPHTHDQKHDQNFFRHGKGRSDQDYSSLWPSSPAGADSSSEASCGKACSSCSLYSPSGELPCSGGSCSSAAPDRFVSR